MPGANDRSASTTRGLRSRWSGRTSRGTRAPDRRSRLTADTGYFWFFTNTNVELVVKVLDAAAHQRPLLGVLRRSFERRVHDHGDRHGDLGRRGRTRTPPESSPAPGTPGLFSRRRMPAVAASGRAASAELGLRRAGSPGGAVLRESTAAAASPTRLASAWRPAAFAWRSTGRTSRARPAGGRRIGLTADTGYFWFFNSANVELVVKVLDARGVNGQFWVFYGALSNVEYEIVVIDTATGESRRYKNPSGALRARGIPRRLSSRPGHAVSRPSPTSARPTASRPRRASAPRAVR